MTSEKKLWVALVAVALIAIGAYYFPIQRDKIVAGAIGSATNYYSLVLDSTLTVGGTILQTGGSAFGEISTKSSPASFAICRAFSIG